MKIKPIKLCGSHYSYSLPSDITPAQIKAKLGFEPNAKDDPYKVTMSWGFEIDGTQCGIWDYKGRRWSVYDPSGHKIKQLFNT